MVTCHPPTAVARQQEPQADLELFVCPFVCLVDSREQSPWPFSNLVIEKRLWVVKRKVVGLKTGDYSIEGHADSLVVERKSGDDLIGSITAGNARFRREHERMKTIVDAGGFACVIIEDSLSHLCDELDQDAGRRVTSDMVIGAVASWPMRFSCPWFFAGDRRRAELLAFKILVKWWRIANA